MSEVLLVVLSHPETAQALLTAAQTVARAGASVRIEALAVRRSPSSVIIPSDEVMAGEQFVLMRDSEAKRVVALRHAYDEWLKLPQSRALDCKWIEVEGVLAEEVGRRAANADLIVVERPSATNDDAGHQIVRAAVLDSHRPVLVIPANVKPGFGKRIAIAWKEDGRAVKALIPAIRYFPKNAEFSVLMGYRGDDKPKVMPEPVTDRGIAAKLYPVKIGAEPLGQTILEKATAIGADLLVMGAYAKSPLREMLLTGTTRYILANARIPILMRH
jgi:nucleotide-binding universal stress UspA family protein